MSSTQHQLIEQCATRLRGIVEALDNIHDNTPHRWSTDLDDVHSSAESLLALIKDQAPARSETSFEEWLANELEGEDGQPVPAAVCDIALARRAFNHWPNLEKPAQVGAIRFHAGLSSRLVVEAAQRAYEYKATPEQEAERIERLQAFREQLDPLNLAPHAEAFNEAPAEALKSEQAEAERPEVVAWRYGFSGGIVSDKACLDEWKSGGEYQSLMTVAQHERIVGELRAENERLANDRDRANQFANGAALEINAALARVAELERQEPVALANRGLHAFWVKWTEAAAGLYGPGIKLYAAPVVQAQHSVPKEFIGRLSEFLAQRGATGKALLRELRDMLAAAPGKEVPQAWLDVQAERKRQVEAEGWTPEHDDAHSHGQMARAAACYALAGSSAPNDGTAALLVSLAWPWDEQWWKPTSARRDLVKACALALAEIERLDRAGISQNPQPGATTASS
ncbi:hypothetical protein [Pseudomonas aeruginosa]|uniref:hypothetical protein n=1 Tax=Pseudomonas aeruginosa TaxID=287 RepID=UPI000803F9B8|nr:hypothetical protein [Pseudomonas aeruginosa]ANP62347.1 hypothetical protein A9P90_26895 [Pseudomonas aeruginosa]